MNPLGSEHVEPVDPTDGGGGEHHGGHHENGPTVVFFVFMGLFFGLLLR